MWSEKSSNYWLLSIIRCHRCKFFHQENNIDEKCQKNKEDKGKIKILYEYYVNIGDLILFKRPLTKGDIVYGEEFLELDIKDIQKIVTF